MRARWTLSGPRTHARTNLREAAESNRPCLPVSPRIVKGRRRHPSALRLHRPPAGDASETRGSGLGRAGLGPLCAVKFPAGSERREVYRDLIQHGLERSLLGDSDAMADSNERQRRPS